MGIVSRSGAKASIIMQARENELDELITWERVRTTHQMQSCKTPIQAIETQVLGEPVLELLFALGGRSARTLDMAQVVAAAAGRRTVSRLWI